MKLPRDLGRCRGVVDEDGAGAKRAERAVCSERHLAEIVVVADTGKDKFGAGRRLGRGAGEPPAELRDPGFGLGARAVEHHDVAGPTHLEVPGHGVTHDAEPNPGDFAHWPDQPAPNEPCL